MKIRRIFIRAERSLHSWSFRSPFTTNDSPIRRGIKPDHSFHSGVVPHERWLILFDFTEFHTSWSVYQ
jgi:hypothetical protein